MSLDVSTLTNHEVELKSIVSDDRSKVFIELKIPDEMLVGFELFDADNKIVHYWHDQTLATGSHFLKLDLPELSSGNYVLKTLIDNEEYKHLIWMP